MTAPDPRPRLTGPADPAAILIVDDQPANLLALEATLAPLGVAIVAADSGAAALSQLLGDREFAVAVMDIRMPDLNGIETVRIIRSRERTRALPVIFVSAENIETTLISESYALGGVADVIQKPFDPSVLRAKVQVFVQLAQMRDALAAARAAQLTAELAQSASDENRQQERAEAAATNQAKDEFLAMLGHELRNPLAPIVTALQLMELRHGDILQRERAVIDRQVRHLKRLVEDLLDVSRITRGQIQLSRKPIELAEVVAGAIEMVSPLIEQNRHTLIVSIAHEGLLLNADPTRLAQVVSNLLTNAARYTPEAGRIVLSADRVANDVTLSVRDSGRGIASDLLPHVFELFVQGRQSSDRAEGGMGLGLAIVRRLVELHGGEIRAHSAGVGLGSEFVVRLPALTTQPTKLTPAAPPSGHVADSVRANGKKILIVDDNTDAADLLSEVLSSLGHTVRTANDGPTALTLATAFVPDVALLDIGLPVMDGFELARLLRQQPGLDRIRLIAVTGYGQDSDRDRSREAGFDAHLTKPVDVDMIEKTISGLSADSHAS